MASASDIWKARADFILGRADDPALMSVGYNAVAPAGVGRSFNKDLGTFVNRGWYTYHWRRDEIPKWVDGLDFWLADDGFYITGRETCSRHIYGDWNIQNLLHAYGLTKLIGATKQKLRLESLLVNFFIICALATEWKHNQVLICGDRSWVVKGKDQGLFDEQGRWKEPYALDSTSVTKHLMFVLGLGEGDKDCVKAYRQVGGDTLNPLTASEQTQLKKLISPSTSMDELRKVLADITPVLSVGPYFEDPLEILRTNNGITFVLNHTKGGSTSAVQAIIWTENPANHWSPSKEIHWWDFDPRYGHITTDPPKRKVARKADAYIRRLGFYDWEIRANSPDNDHYDILTKSYLRGPVVGKITGDLIYHIRYSREALTIEFDDAQAPSRPWWKRLWDWIKSLI